MPTPFRSILLAAFLAAASGAAPAAAQDLRTEDQKTLYALGLIISGNLAGFRLTEAELDIVRAGLTDGTLNRERKVDLKTYGPKIEALRTTRFALAAAEEKKASQAFLAKAAAEKGAVRGPSGLVLIPLKPGSGPSPKAADRVKVHYHGTLTDGTVFDSSRERGQPAVFPLTGVIKCWTEGVPLMKVGETSRLVCPAELAYGDRGAPPVIKPGATLVFELELIEIVK
jgi:FKBP-type peptidyl-prolyl cis-trans isomerase FkpA/FKBP-type peptidyl-prolyl cis-trans isomerase FklB